MNRDTSLKANRTRGFEHLNGRQWVQPNGAAESPGGMAGMADGAPGQHRREDAGTSNPLQDRHSEPSRLMNRHRGGRPAPQDPGDAKDGPEEEPVPGETRLGSPQIPERTGNEKPGGSEIPDRVFNIETGTGNYFAGGLLVHNSHKLKSAAGKISRFASQVADKSRRRLALTGTPMPHDPLDIYAQYRALDKRVFGVNHSAFKNQYAEFKIIAKPIVTEDEHGNQAVTYPKKTTGYKNLDELNQKFYGLAFRVTAAETLDLPGAIETYMHVEMNPKARRLYDNMAVSFMAEMETGEIVTAANALTRIVRFQQMTSGFARTEAGKVIEIDTAKQQALSDILGGLPLAEPVVVFARFQNDLDVIARLAQKMRRPHYEISGRVKSLDEWNERGGVLAVQIQAGGLGLDLTAARYCVYYSLGYNLGDYLQSIARLHRPGQTSLVDYIHLVMSESIDEIVVEALADKEDVINRILETRDLTNGRMTRAGASSDE